MPTSLKLKRLEKLLHLNEGKKQSQSKIVESINKKLLNRYSIAIDKAEKLTNLLMAAHMNDLGEIAASISNELNKELQQATNFRGTKDGLPGSSKVVNTLRSLFGKYYKRGALKKLALFVEQFKKSISNVIDYVNAALPRTSSSRKDIDKSIKEMIRSKSLTLDEDRMREIIINAFEYSDKQWSFALDDTADAILEFSIENLLQIKQQVEEIDDNIDDQVEAIGTMIHDNDVESSKPKTPETPESSPKTPETQQDDSQSIDSKSTPDNVSLDADGLANELSKLAPEKVDAIVRKASRRRRKIN